MSFQSPWSRIPLGLRWAVSLFLAAVVVVLLVRFVDHHSSSGEVPVSAKNLRVEDRQAEVVIEQQQAPVTLTVATGTSPKAALAAGVRRDMHRQIEQATIDGPLQRVHCVVHGGTLARTGYHCLATAEGVDYPFLAVATASDHRLVFCEKVYPPSTAENFPVSRSCRT